MGTFLGFSICCLLYLLICFSWLGICANGLWNFGLCGILGKLLQVAFCGILHLKLSSLLSLLVVEDALRFGIGESYDFGC